MNKINTLMLALIALFTYRMAFRPNTLNLIRLRLSLPKQSQPVPAANVAETEPAKEPVASTTRPIHILTPNSYDHEDVLLGRVQASTLRSSTDKSPANGTVATMDRPSTETVNPAPAPTQPAPTYIPGTIPASALQPAVTKPVPPTTSDELEIKNPFGLEPQPSRRLRYSLLAAAVLGSIGLLVLTYALGDTDRKVREVASMGGNTIQPIEVKVVNEPLEGTNATRYFEFERNMRHVPDANVPQAVVTVKEGWKVRRLVTIKEIPAIKDRDYTPGERFADTKFIAYQD